MSNKNSVCKTIQFAYNGIQHEVEIEIFLYHDWTPKKKYYKSFMEDLVIESIYDIEHCKVIEFESAPQGLIELIKKEAEDSLEDK